MGRHSIVPKVILDLQPMHEHGDIRADQGLDNGQQGSVDRRLCSGVRAIRRHRRTGPAGYAAPSRLSTKERL